MKITILGCGGSTGVPMIGGRWGDCDPTEPRNRRRRPSILVEQEGTVLLIDTSPDLRAQLLDAGVGRIDHVLYTHEHADHVHGIDELREVYRLRGGTLIDVHAAPRTMASITHRFAYLFDSDKPPINELYRPILRARLIDGAFRLGPIEVVPFEQDHGICATLGFRMGPVAYSTDVVALPESAFAALRGVGLWIVDCLRDGAPHPTHANLEQTLRWIDRVRPQRALLTHMNHQADYATLRARLPAGVEPAYDGQIIEIPSENNCLKQYIDIEP